MLKSIKLINYRCFKNSTIYLKDVSVIVGQNNAGKSTIIEALRIISIVSRKIKTSLMYTEPPESLNLSKNKIGLKVLVDGYKIDLRSIVYFYEDNIAEIVADFDDGICFNIYLNTDVIHACIYDKNGKLVTKRKQITDLNSFSTQIAIMPPLNLIRENEKKISKETIEKDKYTYLSSLHFRNEILLYKNEFYLKFKEIAEKIWDDLFIEKIEYINDEDEFIYLGVKDNTFPAELGLMGSGLQVYLQIIWFIAQQSENSTIILDEPDVYLHPDLQKKIYKYIKKNFKQIIISSHSVEIIAESELDSIIAINKKLKVQKYSKGVEQVQSIINDIGSSQNMALLRLGIYKKCIFVEGLDKKLLNRFFEILYPENVNSINDLPIIELGSFSRFDEALGASRLFYSEAKNNFECLCILDRDYHLDEELEKIREKAAESHLNLHIWEKKELENYVINPNVLYRIIKNTDSLDVFKDKLNKYLDCFHDEVIDSFANSYHLNNKSMDIASINRLARSKINPTWNNLETKIKFVNGKLLINKIILFMKDEYNIKCSKNIILNHFTFDDIDQEIRDVINKMIE